MGGPMVITPAVGDGVPYPLIAAGERDVALLPMKRSRSGLQGGSFDNALAETINGLFKAEVIHRRGPWRNAASVEFATLEWVDWFNHRRLLEPIGNVPPPKPKRATMRTPTSQLWQPDSNKIASGKRVIRNWVTSTRSGHWAMRRRWSRQVAACSSNHRPVYGPAAAVEAAGDVFLTPAGCLHDAVEADVVDGNDFTQGVRTWVGWLCS